MAVFEYVLIMLAAVLLSNLINRFVPALSAPLVQIALGVIISLIPFGAFGMDFVLEPELFFVLFLAPLVFRNSYTADKKTLWRMRKPIVGTAVVLVFITVIAVGCFTHLLIPAIPLAAAFALIGALGPTDVVAVEAVAKRADVPHKVMSILSGESIINDASGIICFQFAIIAMTTGGFSLWQASLRFILLGFGGLIAGIVMTGIKYMLVRKLRGLGIENVTLHILIEILTPFIIYMSSEALSVSGILAVFASGLAHSIMREKFNPETVKLNIAQDSVWEFLTFTLEGLVFVMLGLQLPAILKTIPNEEFPLSGFKMICCVFLLVLALLALRFLWWIATVRKKTYFEEGSPIGAVKAAMIFSLSGARGTVTLAIIMSLPLSLKSGAAFPDRDLAILLASGVIIISLLVANFILPLLAGRKTRKKKSAEEHAVYSEIIQGVISRLNSEATSENRFATEIVIRSFARRSATVRGRHSHREESHAEKELRKQVFLWERENTVSLLEDESIDKIAAQNFLAVLEERAKIARSGEKPGFFKRFIRFLKHLVRSYVKIGGAPNRGNFIAIIDSNQQYVLRKLSGIKTEENAAAVEKLSSEFELMSEINRSRRVHNSMVDSAVYAVAARGFSIESELIQEMFEADRISWEAAREMRSSISILEAQLQIDFLGNP